MLVFFFNWHPQGRMGCQEKERERKEERLRQKWENLHELPYTEIVKFGTIRLTSVYAGLIHLKNPLAPKQSWWTNRPKATTHTCMMFKTSIFRMTLCLWTPRQDLSFMYSKSCHFFKTWITLKRVYIVYVKFVVTLINLVIRSLCCTRVFNFNKQILWSWFVEKTFNFREDFCKHKAVKNPWCSLIRSNKPAQILHIFVLIQTPPLPLCTFKG